jgi:outer membrane translocation and assembly module TamA
VSSSAYPGSVFAAERAGLVGTEPYAALQFSTGAVLDTRDNEPTPSGGQLVEATVRVGTSVSGSEPMTYTGLNAYLRSYHRVARQPDLVLAARLLVDSLHGQVPLVELAHAGGYTIDRTHGYTRGQRGVPLGRFHGRHKALASLEARSMPWAIGTGHRLGLAAFGEAGWVAQNLTDDLPTIWNLGFGFRWLIGRANLLRVDWSYAPSAALIRPHAPLAIYIDLSQAF